MARWAQRPEFKRLAGKLSATHGRDFEREVLPLLRVIAPTLVAPPALGSFDQAGVDLVAWRNDGGLSLVVQCKGFKVEEIALGKAQIESCQESIATFVSRGLTADTYLLVHNRFGLNDGFKREVSAALQTLQQSGRVRRAELWDQSQLLKQVGSALESHLVRRLQEVSQAERARKLSLDRRVESLHAVPYKMSRLTFDRHRLQKVEELSTTVADPARKIVDFDTGNLWLLLGDAGFGKTTVALRSTISTERIGFFFRAARLSAMLTNTKGLLAQCVAMPEFFTDFPVEDVALLEELSRAFMAALLMRPETPAFLVIDGLDESLALSRRGGLQWLFNALLDVKVPVVLVSRTEFWRKKRADFETSFGLEAQVKGGRQAERTALLIELLPWNNQEIIALATRFRTTLTDPQQQGRIDELIQLVEQNRYHQLYGDIPRRPLFLSYILETVAEHGVHGIGRRGLLIEWASLKIRRDVVEPMFGGGPGRIPITSDREGVDETIELSFRIMRRAAQLMTQVREQRLELLPSCSEEELTNAVKAIEHLTDTTGIVLHSLLVPVEKMSVTDESRLRFAHQIHHELFLALQIERDPSSCAGIALPPEVSDWLAASCS